MEPVVAPVLLHGIVARVAVAAQQPDVEAAAPTTGWVNFWR